MNKRKILTLTSVLIGALIAGSSAFAQDSLQLQQLSLTPSADSALEFDSLKARVFADGSVGVHGRMQMNIDKREGYFHLSINVKKETYTVTAMTEIEKKALLAKTGTGRNVNAMPLLNNPVGGSSNMHADTTYYTATLNLLTTDWATIDLCKTKGTVSWYDNGTTVTATTGSPTFTPYNPTSGGTHWFLESSYAHFLYPVNTPVASNRAWAGATYYNWDFPPADEKTSADHWIELEFFPKLPNNVVGYFNFDYLVYGQNDWFTDTDFWWTL